MGIASQLAVRMVLMDKCRLEARAGSWGCAPILPQPNMSHGAGPMPSPGAQCLLTWGLRPTRNFGPREVHKNITDEDFETSVKK